MVSSLVVTAAPLPQEDGYEHTGVATCATSTCHGKNTPSDESNVELNEYRLWSSDDFHSRAFQVLRNAESEAMAAALDLPNAQNAKICLDCHADNVSTDKRGEKFQLSDGVGCEACHGGAQNWLKSHTDPGATHADNLSKGLYPLSDPIARADLCLSCHMGTRDKFATHAIMAAGHPRLTFELDTFTANQPAHYTVDADYIERKGEHPVGYLWVTGQVEAAKRQLSLIETHQLANSMAAGMIELSIYDCHSCHQGMKPRRGRPDDFSGGLPSGGLRLLDHSFDMVAAVVQVTAPATYDTFAQAVRDLHAAHNRPDALGAAILALQTQLEQLGARVKDNPPSPATLREIRRTVAANGGRGRYADFSSAEQAFLAMESLSFGLKDRDQIKRRLDEVFATLENETAFEPARFATASAELARSLQ